MGATAVGPLPDGPPEGLPDGIDDRYHMLVYNGTFYPLADNLSLLRNLSGLYPEEQLYNVPVHIVLLLTLFYVSISVAAIVGNGLVLWVVATSRRMQSVTNTFIANLALADVIIGLFAIPFQVSAAGHSRGPFGPSRRRGLSSNTTLKIFAIVSGSILGRLCSRLAVA